MGFHNFTICAGPCCNSAGWWFDFYAVPDSENPNIVERLTSYLPKLQRPTIAAIKAHSSSDHGGWFANLTYPIADAAARPKFRVYPASNYVTFTREINSQVPVERRTIYSANDVVPEGTTLFAFPVETLVGHALIDWEVKVSFTGGRMANLGARMLPPWFEPPPEEEGGGGGAIGAPTGPPQPWELFRPTATTRDALVNGFYETIWRDDAALPLPPAGKNLSKWRSTGPGFAPWKPLAALSALAGARLAGEWKLIITRATALAASDVPLPDATFAGGQVTVTIGARTATATEVTEVSADEVHYALEFADVDEEDLVADPVEVQLSLDYQALHALRLVLFAPHDNSPDPGAPIEVVLSDGQGRWDGGMTQTHFVASGSSNFQTPLAEDDPYTASYTSYGPLTDGLPYSDHGGATEEWRLQVTRLDPHFIDATQIREVELILTWLPSAPKHYPTISHADAGGTEQDAVEFIVPEELYYGDLWSDALLPGGRWPNEPPEAPWLPRVPVHLAPVFGPMFVGFDTFRVLWVVGWLKNPDNVGQPPHFFNFTLPAVASFSTVGTTLGSLTSGEWSAGLQLRDAGRYVRGEATTAGEVTVTNGPVVTQLHSHDLKLNWYRDDPPSELFTPGYDFTWDYPVNDGPAGGAANFPQLNRFNVPHWVGDGQAWLDMWCEDDGARGLGFASSGIVLGGYATTTSGVVAATHEQWNNVVVGSGPGRFQQVKVIDTASTAPASITYSATKLTVTRQLWLGATTDAPVVAKETLIDEVELMELGSKSVAATLNTLDLEIDRARFVEIPFGAGPEFDAVWTGFGSERKTVAKSCAPSSSAMQKRLIDMYDVSRARPFAIDQFSASDAGVLLRWRRQVGDPPYQYVIGFFGGGWRYEYFDQLPPLATGSDTEITMTRCLGGCVCPTAAGDLEGPACAFALCWLDRDAGGRLGRSYTFHAANGAILFTKRDQPGYSVTRQTSSPVFMGANSRYIYLALRQQRSLGGPGDLPANIGANGSPLDTVAPENRPAGSWSPPESPLGGGGGGGAEPTPASDGFYAAWAIRRDNGSAWPITRGWPEGEGPTLSGWSAGPYNFYRAWPSQSFSALVTNPNASLLPQLGAQGQVVEDNS